MLKTLFSRYTLYPNFPKNRPNWTKTMDKFVIYVHIRRYWYFNTRQYPVHPSAAPQGCTRVLQGVKIPISTDMNVDNLYYTTD